MNLTLQLSWFSSNVSGLLFTETFIRNVLRNVGRHHVDVESLSAADLDQLASLIADALQVVEKQAEKGYRPRDLQTEDQVTGEISDAQQPGVDSWDENISGSVRQLSEENQMFETMPPVSGKYMDVIIKMKFDYILVLIYSFVNINHVVLLILSSRTKQERGEI